MTPAELAAALGGAKRVGPGWDCLCPAHPDKAPSLSIVERNGKVLFTCRAGCDQQAVVDALRARGLWHDGSVRGAKNSRRIVATYGYRGQDGTLRYQVVRFAPKDFRQRRPNGAPDTWLWNMDDVEPLPYRLPELLEDPVATVFIAEGEKDCDALGDHRLTATCNHGGAGKWRPEISPWLAGRNVVILPDNDDAGRAHAQDVARKLTGLAASIRILKLPALPPKGDVSDWLAAGGSADELERLAAAVPPNGHAQPAGADISNLSLAGWLARDIPAPDFLLGEFLSTTCRMMLVGPTGLGKTNFLMAVAMPLATGADYLHWRGCGRPRRILYIDGEMSRRLIKARVGDAVRRCGTVPDTLFFLNREDFPDLPPLNTEAGQKFIDRIIDGLGGIDLALFDNIQALMTGDMKDEQPWQDTLPWVRDLTRRNIGQIWVHHTGHDETHSYGTKTREWQLDTVALMEAIERPDADIAFSLKFTKARERSPDNRSDFDPAVITLANDQWSSERGSVQPKKHQAKDRALELLKDQVTRHGVIPPACPYIPPNTPAITVGQWRKACELGCISEGDERASRKAFERAAKKLLDQSLIGKHDLFVWPTC